MPREKPGWLVAFQRIASGQALDSQNIRLADPARRAEKTLLQDSLDLRLYPAWIALGGSGFLESGQWLSGLLSFWSFRRNRIGGEHAGVSLPKLFSWALNSLIVNAKTWAGQYKAAGGLGIWVKPVQRFTRGYRASERKSSTTIA